MRAHSFFWLLAVLAAPLCPAASSAADGVQVTGQRLVLRDVLPECPGRACEVDLGVAPPAGSSRLVTAAAMLKAIADAGEDTAPFASLAGVRVLSASRALSAREVGELSRPAIQRVVPPGVELVGIEAKAALVVPLLASVGQCTLPALPRRAGAMTSTALVDWMHDGVLVRREPVLVRLVISEPAGRADVPRGHTLTLMIERKSATISAHGVALRDTEIGQIAPFKVQRTGRVVQARVTSQSVAVVQESQ
jgi:hypothetical protein